ncbi:hypothetical protein [Pelistega ratti]|uniref:hypothetical protein n=1 Tax=Pelistega ratti TaxID=2652177 RepID=UPI0013592FB6|nr:hypothetical protein [Pelistega ratti]
MNNIDYRRLVGSRTAKDGFKTEGIVAEKFKNYLLDEQAIEWLSIMGYDIGRIENIEAIQIPTRLKYSDIEKFGSCDNFEFVQKYKKADVQVQLTIKINGVIYRENISIKKANIDSNFNQIDKRSVDTYQKMWKFDEDIAFVLKKFTGEIQPSIYESSQLKNKKRWYLDELPINQVNKLIKFFEKNRVLIFSDILKGRGMLSAEWFLVVKQNIDGSYNWIFKNINEVINFYSQGEISISKKGGLNLGKLTAQRKGGTPDPTSLQFKIKPLDLFNIDNF